MGSRLDLTSGTLPSIGTWLCTVFAAISVLFEIQQALSW
jgi:hypothetical protein